MTIIGFTGHQGIPAVAADYVRAEIAKALEEAWPPVRGVTCLAAGADQLFAEELLAVGGQLIVVIPSGGYESTLEEAPLLRYRELVAASAQTVRLPYPSPTEEAFMAGGQEVVRRCDQLIAVWDGLPAQGLGGTADVVALARELGTPVRVIWPAGVTR